jgi:hypothetical protein
LLPSIALAQTSAVLDEGTFSVSARGTPLGRESFRIDRSPGPGGQVFLIKGQSALGEDRVSTTLGADSLGIPISYKSEHTQRGELVQRLEGRGRPGRFGVLKQTRSGESAREYVLNNGALVIDEDVFHHFFFVPVAMGRSPLTVIAPRSADQGRFRVEERGTEDVEIAGRTLRGRRFALIGSTGGSRDVWIDSQGRLLKVTIPEKGLVAVRDDPPR